MKRPRLNRLPDAWRETLRQQRQQHSWSQTELGDRIGFGQEHVSNIERGITSPLVDTLLDIARVLDLDLVLVPRALVPAVQALVRDFRRGADPSEEDRPMYGFGDDEMPDDATPAPASPAATQGSGEIQ
jgi:HTH-type transcriptional regulator / antitoxin HipB